MKRFCILSLLSLFVIMHSFATVPTAAAISHITTPILGHRGSVWGLENSEEAFLNGVKAGYKLLETDVKVTKDGVYICYHDDNLKRLGGDAMASIVITETNWANLKDIEFTQRRQGRDYTGKICTLERFLEICKTNNVTPVIDLKHTVGFNNDDYSKAAGLVAFVKSKGCESNVVFLSSNHNCLKKIRETSDKVTLFRSSTPNGAKSTNILNFCKTNKVDINVNLDADAANGTMSASHVTTVHNAGLKISVYCVKNYADLQTYQNMGVDNITFEPNIYIEAEPATPTFETYLTTKKKQEVTITGLNLTEDITKIRSNKSVFTVSTTTLSKAGGKLTVTYQPTKVGKDTATIYLESSEGIKRVKVYGTCVAEPLPFTEGWNYSETSEKTTTWASDFTKLRNLDFGNGKLYVVAEGNKIVIVNAITGEQMATMDNTGVSGGAITLVDCKYVGGKIVGCNIATSSSPLKVYVWDDDYAKPRVLLQTSDLGGFSRLGDCLGIRGDLSNGHLMFAGNDTNGYSSIVYYTITDGVCATSPTTKPIQDESGNGVKLGYSPRVIASGSMDSPKWWCNGSTVTPSYVNTSGINPAASTVNTEAVGGNVHGNAVKSMSFDGTSYMVTTAYDADATDKRTHGHIALIKKGTAWNTSELIGNYPAAGLGTTANTSYSTSVATATNGTAGMEMWVLVHNQGVAYYKHGTPKVWNPTLTGTPPTTTDIAQTATNTLNYHLQDGVLSVEGIEPMLISLYTLSGQKVCESKKSNTILFDIPKGMYIAKVIDKYGLVHTIKLFPR